MSNLDLVYVILNEFDDELFQDKDASKKYIINFVTYLYSTQIEEDATLATMMCRYDNKNREN